MDSFPLFDYPKKLPSNLPVLTSKPIKTAEIAPILSTRLLETLIRYHLSLRAYRKYYMAKQTFDLCEQQY